MGERRSEGLVTVSGPDLDLQMREGVGAATSRAITAAQRWSRQQRGTAASFYVRDDSGRARSRVDVETDGTTQVWRLGREAGDAGKPTGHGPANAPRLGVGGSPLRDAVPPGVPDPSAGSAGREQGGSTMAQQKKTTRSSAKKRSARSSARKSTTARAVSRSSAARPSASAGMKRVSAKDAVAGVLKKHGPMTTGDIAQAVLATEGVSLQGKTPVATIAAILSVENGKEDGLFVRVEKGTYALRGTATAA